MNSNNKPKGKRGFSLIEVLVAMALTTVALMGLIQLFLLGIAQNNRSDKMTCFSRLPMRGNKSINPETCQAILQTISQV